MDDVRMVQSGCGTDLSLETGQSTPVIEQPARHDFQCHNSRHCRMTRFENGAHRSTPQWPEQLVVAEKKWPPLACEKLTRLPLGDVSSLHQLCGNCLRESFTTVTPRSRLGQLIAIEQLALFKQFQELESTVH